MNKQIVLITNQSSPQLNYVIMLIRVVINDYIRTIMSKTMVMVDMRIGIEIGSMRTVVVVELMPTTDEAKTIRGRS